MKKIIAKYIRDKSSFYLLRLTVQVRFSENIIGVMKCDNEYVYLKNGLQKAGHMESEITSPRMRNKRWKYNTKLFIT